MESVFFEIAVSRSTTSQNFETQIVLAVKVWRTPFEPRNHGVPAGMSDYTGMM